MKELKDKNELVFNARKDCSIFQNYFSSLAQNLVSLFPNIFTESREPKNWKVSSYYDNKAVSKNLNFQLLEMSREKKLSVLKGLNPSKAAVIDNLSNEFLKDSADVLAWPICQLYNLSIKLNAFPRSCKIES